jgi:SAM-dependent methyltransferase
MSVVRTSKEMIRDLIAKAGLSGIDLTIRRLRGQNVDHLFRASLSERFSAIYENRVWLNGRTVGSLSGSGSELENTEGVRRGLAELLRSLDTRCLLDVGCGDFTWMKEVSFPFRYVGIDIVPGVIAANNASYSSAQRSFQVGDATCDPLPQADATLCREVLFHLAFVDVWRVVENIQKSGSSYLIATNDNNLKYNADVLSGDFRMLNLHRAPFFFPRPTASIPDSSVSPDRSLAVWQVADLPTRQ